MELDSGKAVGRKLVERIVRENGDRFNLCWKDKDWLTVGVKEDLAGRFIVISRYFHSRSPYTPQQYKKIVHRVLEEARLSFTRLETEIDWGRGRLVARVYGAERCRTCPNCGAIVAGLVETE